MSVPLRGGGGGGGGGGGKGRAIKVRRTFEKTFFPTSIKHGH